MPIASYIFLLAAFLLVLPQVVQALRLHISETECFRENIETAESQVQLTLVADDLHGKPVYFDVMARDPRSEVVFSKLELNDAELNFKNTVTGLHTFCIKLSNKSRTHSDTISSPRVKKQLRTVTVDVQTGGGLNHDRVREDDVTGLLQEVSDVQLKVQKLASTVVHMKISNAHHRDVVLSKNRTVTFYAVCKMLMMLALFAVQPVVLHFWFSKHGKYLPR